MRRAIGASALAALLGGRDAGRSPAYRVLADHLRLLVLDGRLPLQVALPSERDLAATLGLSRTTVSAAYALLREQGHLVSRPGARSTTAVPGGRGTPPPGPGPLAPAGVLDLAYATMPAPPGVTHEAYAAALAALPAHLPGHGYDPHGLPVLREAVAARFEARGLPTRPDQVLVTSGAQNALVLLLRALAGPGDRVLVDAPTYPHALDALRSAGCRAVPVGLPEAGGWDLPGIDAALRQTAPRLAYVVADHHNPTGRCMTATERSALVRACRASRTTLVVDETLVDLGLDGPPPAPVAASGRDVVTIGSLSKSFWGGARVGWVRAPAPLVARLAAERTTVDLGSPVVEQLAAVELLARGDDVLPVRRRELAVRRDLLLQLLAEHLPDWTPTPAAGGLSLWVRLPVPMSTALAATAPRFGLRLAAGPRFGVDGAFDDHVRVPFSLPEQDLVRAVDGLVLTAQAVAAQPAGALLRSDPAAVA